MKSRLAFTVIGLLFAAVSAQAQEEPSSPFDMLDTDSSGGIDETEAQAQPLIAEHFAAADVNADGIITLEEFSAAFTRREPDAKQE